MNEPTDESITLLMALGFERNQVVQALKSTGGNVEQAANTLLSPAPHTFSPSNDHGVDLLVSDPPIQGSVSQYDLPDGRSACSCIALAAAAAFLENPSVPILPQFLDAAVRDGHATYLQWKTSSGLATEHSSPEEVLNLFPRIQLDGAVRQGLLPTWEPILRECASSSTSWTAAVITKPPETILVLLSPDRYWIVDSHSRPPRTTAAWAQSFSTLPALCAALSQLFPATLLPDVPDTMLMMYNSFDLYHLTKCPQDDATGG